MEPANCFANVTSDKAELYAPIQAPGFITNTLSARLGLPKEKIHIKLARMGGGFGVRAYGHHLVEALIKDTGFEPVSIGGIDQSIKMEVFGELHEFGALGKAVTKSELKQTG